MKPIDSFPIDPDVIALSADQFAKSIALPKSTFAKMVREGHGPRMFVLGRRRYITRADAESWINTMRNRFVYTKRVNNKASVVGVAL
jgi:hypothetical protein